MTDIRGYIVAIIVLVIMNIALLFKNNRNVKCSSEMADHLSLIPLEILFKNSASVVVNEDNISAGEGMTGPCLFFKVFVVPHLRQENIFLECHLPKNGYGVIFIDGALVFDSTKDRDQKNLNKLELGKHLIAVYCDKLTKEGMACSIRQGQRVFVESDGSWRYKRVGKINHPEKD